MAINNNIHIIRGVINPHYHDNIIIGLQNDSNINYTVQKGDLISLLLIKKSRNPDIHIINDLPITTHTKGAFIIDDNTPTFNQDDEQHMDIQHLEDIMNVHQYINNPVYDIKILETTDNLVVNTSHTDIETP